MVQSNMGLRPVTEEIIEVVSQEQKIKKQVAINGEFVEKHFIRIPVGPERLGESALEKWCRNHYEEPKYLGPWFKVSGYIVLDEKTYTHWKLCE